MYVEQYHYLTDLVKQFTKICELDNQLFNTPYLIYEQEMETRENHMNQNIVIILGQH
jgi:hypothetical protein